MLKPAARLKGQLSVLRPLLAAQDTRCDQLWNGFKEIQAEPIPRHACSGIFFIILMLLADIMQLWK